MTLYRMPVGFGPSQGPRQGPDGRDFNGEPYRTTHVSVSASTTKDALAAVLPPGYSPADDPFVRVQINFLQDVAWLAGRGYNFAEVLFPVVLETPSRTVEGDLVAVMWESMADPIISGREELGLPKLFADIPDLQDSPAGAETSASWCGFEFMSVRLDGYRTTGWPHELEETTPFVKRATGGSTSPRPRLYYKYIPDTSDLTRPEAAYTTLTPTGIYDMKVLSTWAGEGEFAFHRARWEDLPTMSQIVNGLVGLAPTGPMTATVTRSYALFNDLTRHHEVIR